MSPVSHSRSNIPLGSRPPTTRSAPEGIPTRSSDAGSPTAKDSWAASANPGERLSTAAAAVAARQPDPGHLLAPRSPADRARPVAAAARRGPPAWIMPLDASVEERRQEAGPTVARDVAAVVFKIMWVIGNAA